MAGDKIVMRDVEHPPAFPTGSGPGYPRSTLVRPSTARTGVRTGLFDPPLVALALSALWGTVISSAGREAWLEFFLVAGGLAVYYVLSRVPSHIIWRDRDIPILRILVGGAPALVAFYFLLTNDWAQPIDKVAWLGRTRHWLAALEPHLALPSLHPNVVGGGLAMALPLQVAALAARRRHDDDRWGAASGLRVVLLSLSGAALLLSSLRGAWLALVAAVGIWAGWQLFWSLASRRRYVVLAVSSLAVVGAMIWLVASYGDQWLAQRPDRVTIWHNSWDLAWDYFFTGLGLRSFAMAYSSYALLIHVPYLTHAHNLYLDIWLNLGLPGLLAFVWLLVVVLTLDVRRRSRDGINRRPAHWHRWRVAGRISLMVIVIHGLLDDSYLGYGGAGALVLFVPAALLSRRARRERGEPRCHGHRAVAVWFGAATAAIVVVLLSGPSRALLDANLGALLQTRAELSVYRWPRWPVQDAVRRSSVIDLAPAMRLYQAALTADPANVEANRRLGQIELSIGDYESAWRHLEVAFKLAPSSRATCQMFGESLALTGNVSGAADLWRTLSLDQNQLAIRQAWYDTTRRARDCFGKRSS
jgi:putative inorganic carbon (HCO3(-)) transporter